MGAAKIDFCSSTGTINYENVYEVAADTQIVVNATPVGMFPNVDDSPVDLSRFSRLYAAADIVYNPSRTFYRLKTLYYAESTSVPKQNCIF